MALAGSAMGQSQAARGELEARHPDVRIADSRGWVSSVFGVPMTWGETPQIAAEDWLASYAPVLVDDWADLEYASSLTLRDGRVSLLFKQKVDDLEVLHSRVKVLVHGVEGGYRVGFVGAKLARDVQTRARDVLVTAGEAELAAIESERGLTLDTFTEPELVATGAGGEDLGDARVMWRLRGWNHKSPIESFTFLVDAVTGEVVTAESNLFRFTDTITGTVTGNGTPGLRPHIPDPSECENEPVSMAVPWAEVQLIDDETVLRTVYADVNGEYALSWATIPSTAEVVFNWAGPGWRLYEAVFPKETLQSLIYPSSGSFPEIIDHHFNPAPASEKFTAAMNCMIHIGQAWMFFKDRVNNEGLYPGLDDECQLFPHAVSWGGPAWIGGTPQIIFEPKTSTRENSAFSTIIAHEYGHYLLHYLFEMEPDVVFHEGFADTVAHLIHDTPVVGSDFWGCDTCGRSPLEDDPTYPMCDATFEVSCNPALDVCASHIRGMLLSATWLDLRALAGLETTRQLFVDWAFIASGDRPEPASGCTASCGSLLQSADEQTLIEVLVADDDDNDITNGTPNEAEICAAFAGRGIYPSANLGVCGDSARSVADLNEDGVLDAHDVAMFLMHYENGDLAADLDANGSLDVFDWIVFQNAFSKGLR